VDAPRRTRGTDGVVSFVARGAPVLLLGVTAYACHSVTGAAAPPRDAGGMTSDAAGADAQAGDDGGASDATGDAPLGEAGTLTSMQVTFYGWDDNSPPGDSIAYGKSAGYPTLHDAAGGTGTYADPLTMATDKAELAPGTIVYVPFVRKYAVMEDDCAQCDSDWSNSQAWHIDLWMNSDGTEDRSALDACEGQWTRNATTVEIGPPPGRPFATAPLFDPATNTCRSTP